MIDDKDVTAKWARETANTVLGQKVSGQVKKCLEHIKLAVGRNDMNCQVQMYADPLTIKELANRGFQCKQVDDQRDGSYLQIAW